VQCAKENNGTHRTLDSVVSFGLGALDFSSGTARLRAGWRQDVGLQLEAVGRGQRGHEMEYTSGPCGKGK